MYPVYKERIHVKREEELFGLVEALGRQPLDGSWAPDGAIVYHVDTKLRVTKTEDDIAIILKAIVPDVELADAAPPYTGKGMTLSKQTTRHFSNSQVYHIGTHSNCLTHGIVKDFVEKATRAESYTAMADDEYGIKTWDVSDEEVADKMITKMFYEHLCPASSSVNSRHIGSSSDCGMEKLLEKGKALQESFLECSKISPAAAVERCTAVMAPTQPGTCGDLECGVNTDTDDENEHVMKVVRSDEVILYGNLSLKTSGDRDVRQYLKVTQNFSLSYLWNMLFLSKSHYPGLTASMIYLGTNYSKFAIHIEDSLLWSMSYLHFGACKVWIVIPPHARVALDFHLSRSGTFLSHTSCRNVLGHKVLFPTMSWLKVHHIPFKVIIQKPGDLVVLLPDAPHFGFNSGWNFAESINFATSSWIEIGINALKCNCYRQQIHLNIEVFIAAFREDLLRAFKISAFIPTPYQVKSDEFLLSTMRAVAGSNQYFRENSQTSKAEVLQKRENKCQEVPQKREKKCQGIPLKREKKRQEVPPGKECSVENCHWSTRNRDTKKAKETYISHLKTTHEGLMARDGERLLIECDRLFAAN